MQPKYAKIFNFLYGPWLWVIGIFYRSYTANRARLQRLKANEGVARLLRMLTVVVVVVWILIWLFASDADRNRLTDEVRQTIGGLNSGAKQPELSQPAVD